MKHKFFTYLLLVVAASMFSSVAVFYYKKNILSKKHNDINQLSNLPAAASTTEPSEKRVEAKVVEYLGKDIKFRFKYIAEYDLTVASSSVPQKTGYISPESGALIIDLMIRARDEYYADRGFYDIHIYSMAKGDRKKTYDDLVSDGVQVQKQRESDCSKIYPDIKSDDYNVCAFNGGGWSFSFTKFAGADAVQAMFTSEEGGRKFTLIPSKGIIIEGWPEKVLKDFVFLK